MITTDDIQKELIERKGYRTELKNKLNALKDELFCFEISYQKEAKEHIKGLNTEREKVRTELWSVDCHVRELQDIIDNVEHTEVV